MPKLQGVTCANFGLNRGPGKRVCMNSWHGSCYRAHPKDQYPILTTQDLEDSLVDDEQMEEEDPLRFKEGRDGDHLLTPFVCDYCVFEDLEGRTPNFSLTEDECNMVAIRRVLLDSLWARERSTVAANRREGDKYLSIHGSLGVTNPYRARGPYDLTDDPFGIRAAVGMVYRSLDEGKNAPTIQFGTTRRIRSHVSNFEHTCPGGIGDVLVGDEGKVSAFSKASTNSLWFRRFAIGCHRRMGDIWVPDRAITIEEIKSAMLLLEEDWKAYGQDIEGQKQTCLTAITLIAGFFAGLRGEEIVRTDLGAIRKHWHEAIEYPRASHVPLMLAGRFKKETGEKLFCQPLAAQTKSGVDIKTWFYRTIWVMEAMGVTAGPLFRVSSSKADYKRASMGDLEPLFHGILKKIQVRFSKVIPKDVMVEEEYSVYRSLRRGATSEARNVGIPQEVIEANNRWRKHMRSKGMVPGMSMMERYTDAKASVLSLIRFSKNL